MSQQLGSFHYVLKIIGNNFNEQLKSVKTSFNGLKEKAEKAQASIKRYNAEIKAVAAVSVAALGVSVKAFSDFESGLTNVNTLLSGDELKQYGGSLQGASQEAVGMGFAIKDSNKALFDMVSALGASEKTSEDFKVAQKLAIGGVTDLSTSVDGLTSVMNAYGKETTSANDVANAFFSAQKAGKTTVAELAANVGKVAPIAKQAGIGFQTLLATMSQLTLGGLSTEMATTALRSAISGLINPSEQARKVLEKYDVPIGAAALQSANFTDVLKKLALAAKEDKDALAEMIPSQEALTAIAALGLKKLEIFKKSLKRWQKIRRMEQG